MTNEYVGTSLSAVENETLKRFHNHLSRRQVQKELLSVIGSSFGIVGLFFRDLVESVINTVLEYLPGHTAPVRFDPVWAICRMDSIELIAIYARQLPDDVFPGEDIPSKELIKKIQEYRLQEAEVNEESRQPAGV